MQSVKNIAVVIKNNITTLETDNITLTAGCSQVINNQIIL